MTLSLTWNEMKEFCERYGIPSFYIEFREKYFICSAETRNGFIFSSTINRTDEGEIRDFEENHKDRIIKQMPMKWGGEV